ncbi:hypothetical protein MNZ22_05650 [Aeromonas encheleia]|nr:hypothetical protein [Aeromonas encheleia]UNP89813.1 hypothetical protein MNZ22_05650 [Aeromonas encheleia]
MLTACKQQGGDPDALLLAAGLTPFDINREHGRILAQSHYRLLSLMQGYLSGFHEGILSYEIAQLYEHYPVLISLCLNQPSPRAAIEALLRYRTVIGNCDDYQVRLGALHTQYEYINQGPAALGASQAIPNFVILFRILRAYVPALAVSVGFRRQAACPSPSAGSLLRYPLPLGSAGQHPAHRQCPAGYPRR